MFVGICNPDAVSIRIFNPKKRTENTYTLFGRIAKLRLSVVQIHLNTAEREQFIKIPQKEFWWLFKKNELKIRLYGKNCLTLHPE